ncbi:MAG: protein arginine kinase [Clostridia bacterium]
MWFRELSKDSDVVVSSRIRFARSIVGYKFPNAISSCELSKIVKLVEDSIDNKKYKLFKMKDIDEITEKSLMEQHLISKEFVGNEDGAILMNDDSTIVTMINEEDHLRIQSFESGFNLEKCYDRLVEFTNELNKKIEFAINDKYGYLASCPTNVGSGMRVSVMLHLPGLYKMGLLSKILDQASSIGFSVRGLYGENSAGLGYMYQISNQKTLGVNDQDIIAGVEAVVATIIEQERRARKVLQKNSIELEDEIYRAYGILKNARTISDDEAMNLLSKARLGTSLGLLKETELKKINALMIDIHSSTLKSILKEDISKEEENEKRASYIREELK